MLTPDQVGALSAEEAIAEALRYREIIDSQAKVIAMMQGEIARMDARVAYADRAIERGVRLAIASGISAFLKSMPFDIFADVMNGFEKQEAP